MRLFCASFEFTNGISAPRERLWSINSRISNEISMMTTFVYPSVRLLLTFNLHPPDGDIVVVTHYVSHQVAILGRALPSRSIGRYSCFSRSLLLNQRDWHQFIELYLLTYLLRICAVFISVQPKARPGSIRGQLIKNKQICYLCGSCQLSTLKPLVWRERLRLL